MRKTGSVMRFLPLVGMTAFFFHKRVGKSGCAALSDPPWTCERVISSAARNLVLHPLLVVATHHFERSEKFSFSKMKNIISNMDSKKLKKERKPFRTGTPEPNISKPQYAGYELINFCEQIQCGKPDLEQPNKIQWFFLVFQQNQVLWYFLRHAQHNWLILIENCCNEKL